MTDFSHTRAALARYDAEAAEREAQWAAAENNEDAQRAMALEQQAIAKVQDAFYEDTQHVNSREHCRSVDIATARRYAGVVDPASPTPPGAADSADDKL